MHLYAVEGVTLVHPKCTAVSAHGRVLTEGWPSIMLCTDVRKYGFGLPQTPCQNLHVRDISCRQW